MADSQLIEIKDAANMAWNNHWNARKLKHLPFFAKKPSSVQETQLELISPSKLSRGVFIHDLMGKRGFYFEPRRLMQALQSGVTIYGIGG